MDSWKRFNEIPLPDNEDFYSHLNMKKKTQMLTISTLK